MFKIEEATKVIIFSYEKEKIFNNTALKSAYNARNIAKGDNPKTDDLIMSDDEKDAFTVGIQSILPDIYEILIKLTSGVADAYSVTETEILIKIKNNEAYNNNVVGMVDASILECIINGSLRSWFDTCAQPDLLKLYAEKYNYCLRQLYDRAFQLRKKQISSNLGQKQ